MFCCFGAAFHLRDQMYRRTPTLHRRDSAMRRPTRGFPLPVGRCSAMPGFLISIFALDASLAPDAGGHQEIFAG